MNVILLGMMGAGKSSVGRELAERLHLRWVDTDEMIERAHGRIADLFARFGEAHFRLLEKEVAEKLSHEDGLVISTGGGFVLHEENVTQLKKNGKAVYLRAKAETLFKRIEFDGSRPLLKSKEEGLVQLERKLKERAPIYERLADKIIDTDGLTLQKTAEKVAHWIRGGKV